MRLLSTDYERVAPDFVLTEFAQVVLKRVRVGAVSIADGRRDSVLLSSMVKLIESPLLVPGALEIAYRFQRSIYDSLYVCLALREQCQLVTADLRLYNALSRDLPETMLWVGDIS